MRRRRGTQPSKLLTVLKAIDTRRPTHITGQGFRIIGSVFVVGIYGMQRGPNRRNSRNECIRLRALLLSACRRLDEYGIELPERVGKWWKVQKNLALMGRIKKSEFGLLQMAIAAEEEKDEKAKANQD